MDIIPILNEKPFTDSTVLITEEVGKMYLPFFFNNKLTVNPDPCYLFKTTTFMNVPLPEYKAEPSVP